MNSKQLPVIASATHIQTVVDQYDLIIRELTATRSAGIFESTVTMAQLKVLMLLSAKPETGMSELAQRSICRFPRSPAWSKAGRKRPGDAPNGRRRPASRARFADTPRGDVPGSLSGAGQRDAAISARADVCGRARVRR